MKMHRMIRVALIAASAASVAMPLAMAQPPGQDDMNHGRHEGKGHGHGPKRMPPGQEMHETGGPPPGEYRHWNKGDRLPDEYRDRQYVIDDWREYHLTPPPRGYHWVGIGGDYLLVAIPTGIVIRIGP